MRSTKIVATIGPSSSEPDVLERMIAAGMDVARLNFAHDARVVLTPQEVEGTAERLPVAWQGFSELVDEGDVCYLADGAVRLRVDGVADGEVVTKVEVGGSVASRQGLNLPNVTVSLPAVSDEDIALMDAGLDMRLDFFALSF